MEGKGGLCLLLSLGFTMTTMKLFGKMEVQSTHMKPQSSGMTGMIEGDEDLMSKAWSTTPLPMCPKCKTYE